MVGVVQGKVRVSRLDKSWKVKKKVPRELIRLSRILSI